MMEFGIKLKQIRESKNLSQEHIGEKLGIGQPGVSKIENNARELTVRELYEYAKAFNMSVKDLLVQLDPTQNTNITKSNAKVKLELDLSIEDLKKIDLKEKLIELLK